MQIQFIRCCTHPSPYLKTQLEAGIEKLFHCSTIELRVIQAFIGTLREYRSVYLTSLNSQPIAQHGPLCLIQDFFIYTARTYRISTYSSRYYRSYYFLLRIQRQYIPKFLLESAFSYTYICDIYFTSILIVSMTVGSRGVSNSTCLLYNSSLCFCSKHWTSQLFNSYTNQSTFYQQLTLFSLYLK